MKIKLNELLGKREALGVVIGKEINPIASFKLSKAVKLIADELGNFDKIRNDLITKYGEEDEKGGRVIKPNTDAMGKFNEELKPILEEEVEIDIKPIKLKDLGEDFKIEAKYMLELADFVIEE